MQTYKSLEDKISEAAKIILVDCLINNKFIYSESLTIQLIDNLFKEQNFVNKYIDSIFEDYKPQILLNTIFSKISTLDNPLSSNKIFELLFNNKYFNTLLTYLDVFKPNLYKTIINYIIDKLVNIFDSLLIEDNIKNNLNYI